MPTDRPQRIGFLAHHAPAPNGVAAAKLAHGLVHALRVSGHEVKVLARRGPVPASTTAEYDSVKMLPGPAFPRWSLARRIYHRLRPFAHDHSRSTVAMLAEQSRDFDFLIADETFSGWLAAEGSRCPFLLHSHCLRTLDAEVSDQQPIPSPTLRRMFRAERQVVRRVRHHVTASSRVADRIAQWSPRSSIRIIPVGLDMSGYPARATIHADRHPQVVCHFGSMTWEANRTAAIRLLTRIWPEITRRCPNARLQVIGPDAPSLAQSIGVLQRPEIEIRDRVEDITPYWNGAGILIHPCGAGSGVKLKVMEALAHGVAVVTTSTGAEGLSLKHGVHALIAESDAELIENATALLQSPDRLLSLGSAGRAHLDDDLSPERISAALIAAAETMREESS
jgi:glycosyltransferase involved in cell wall biosynthesis